MDGPPGPCFTSRWLRLCRAVDNALILSPPSSRGHQQTVDEVQAEKGEIARKGEEGKGMETVSPQALTIHACLDLLFSGLHALQHGSTRDPPRRTSAQVIQMPGTGS